MGEQGWLVEKVKCDVCGHIWVGVWPAALENRLECSNCGHMAGEPMEEDE
jgi:hypothetical protein